MLAPRGGEAVLRLSEKRSRHFCILSARRRVQREAKLVIDWREEIPGRFPVLFCRIEFAFKLRHVRLNPFRPRRYPGPVWLEIASCAHPRKHRRITSNAALCHRGVFRVQFDQDRVALQAVSD